MHKTPRVKVWLSSLEDWYAELIETSVRSLPLLPALIVYVLAWGPLLAYLSLRFIFVPRRLWPNQ